ncbi:hypothetical protein C8R45DRAFT_938548 [Mycena sanguinolenta]|nr:hypothetical protein C8R45DRAFT_938548 [Mycena sanguinolenta]
MQGCTRRSHSDTPKIFPVRQQLGSTPHCFDTEKNKKELAWHPNLQLSTKKMRKHREPWAAPAEHTLANSVITRRGSTPHRTSLVTAGRGSTPHRGEFCELSKVAVGRSRAVGRWSFKIGSANETNLESIEVHPPIRYRASAEAELRRKVGASTVHGRHRIEQTLEHFGWIVIRRCIEAFSWLSQSIPDQRGEAVRVSRESESRYGISQFPPRHPYASASASKISQIHTCQLVSPPTRTKKTKEKAPTTSLELRTSPQANPNPPRGTPLRRSTHIWASTGVGERTSSLTVRSFEPCFRRTCLAAFFRFLSSISAPAIMVGAGGGMHRRCAVFPPLTTQGSTKEQSLGKEVEMRPARGPKILVGD